MTARRLLDTDVVVEYLRGREPAVAYLEGLDGELLLSVVTIGELYAGLRDDVERQALERFFAAFELLPLDAATARLAGDLRRQWGPSHGVGLADAFIAATARSRDAELVTFNRKHFPMIQRISVPYRR